MQFFDDRVILRIILKSAARVDDTRQTEPVEFAHEMPRRIQLVFRRQLRTFCERGVKNRRVWPCDQQAGGIAFVVTLNFAARWIWRVLRVTASAQRRLVKQSAAIQVQDEHRSLGRNSIDFI